MSHLESFPVTSFCRLQRRNIQQARARDAILKGWAISRRKLVATSTSSQEMGHLFYVMLSTFESIILSQVEGQKKPVYTAGQDSVL